ncbi:N-acetylglucosamine-6-phosphate deacetylase [Oricola indica]|jgi:N-acetylglucosamine-6-phosphate deacetylase|uniref:N-acetylglucosamine-6-phosphate deacetylase n=1 Tax=Oricola indica TaxID=2872591 RepID=UPI001CBC4887|nr:N-acetylglucosamine-6-phosphate deacetylase [Oricola indica]
MTVIEGRVLMPNGLRNARVSVEQGQITGIEERSVAGDNLILPGFIDLHCHGGGGADVMEAGDAPSRVARAHAANGTTSFLATTMTAPLGDIEAALISVHDCANNLRNNEAAILGVHLEGPFIDREKLGAQPDFAIEGDTALMERLMALADIRVVTCAPEADPDGAMTGWLRDRGVRVQIGHSSCDYETAAKCFEGGRHGVTHMFNAMSPLHHRAPGIVGAALAHADHAELIPDLLHVHPGAIRAALRAIPNVYAVTDATPASGMPDGDYRLGTQHVRKCGNGVRLEDGTLAGSSLTMHQAFRNLVKIGLSPEEASRRTSTIAAEYLGLGDRGRIVTGAVADLVVLDGSLELKTVILRGTEFSG